MLNRSVGRGVVRALACALLVVAIDAATASLSFAQAPAPGAPAFAAGWQSGTPVSVTGELTVIYADDFKNQRSELVHMIRDERTGRSFQLRFQRETPGHLRSGDRVTAARPISEPTSMWSGWIE